MTPYSPLNGEWVVHLVIITLSAFNKTLARLGIGNTTWAVKWILLQSRSNFPTLCSFPAVSSEPVSGSVSSPGCTTPPPPPPTCTPRPAAVTPGVRSEHDTVPGSQGKDPRAVWQGDYLSIYFLSKICLWRRDGMLCEIFSEISCCSLSTERWGCYYQPRSVDCPHSQLSSYNN